MSRPSRNRKSRRRQLQASHQKNWLTGRHAVTEMLLCGQWLPEEVFVSNTLPHALRLQIEQLAEACDRPVGLTDHARLTELCHSEHHQGLIARMEPFPYRAETELAALVTRTSVDEPTRIPLVVICDRIQDSFNFGAILRSCSAMSATAVVIGCAEQTGVTPQVARSSAGAVNHVPIVQVAELSETVSLLTRLNFCIVAASEKSSAPSWTTPFRQPIALIIGSEATGVSEPLLAASHHRTRIPMSSKVESLNAAVAVGILLYEIRRQRNV